MIDIKSKDATTLQTTAGQLNEGINNNAAIDESIISDSSIGSGVPISSKFDDVYFSKENGLEEKSYVFLEGNNLDARFAQNVDFQICEFGFGTGLNFLITLNLWLENYKPNKKLRFYSIEKYPLPKESIKNILTQWEKDLKIDRLLQTYVPCPGEVKIFSFEEYNVELVIAFQDISIAIESIPSGIDAWFFDGFSPSKNPDMWTPEIMQKVKDKSHNSTTFSTFTSSSNFRKTMISNGFEVKKIKGYGRKREMLVGSYKSSIA